MNRMFLKFVVGLVAMLLVGLGACGQVKDTARLYASEGAGYAVIGECNLPTAERRQNLTALNNWLAEEGKIYRATSLDCDGDGQPDF